MSGRWSPRPRRTAFVDMVTGKARADNGAYFTVPAQAGGGCLVHGPTGLLETMPKGAERVYLVNVPEAWWAISAQLAPGAPWIVSTRGHHVDPNTPVLRFRHTLDERDVELRDVSEWFGVVTSVDTAHDAWRLLAARLARMENAPLLAGPSTTGRQMLEAGGTLGEPLETDLARLCREGVQAGRVELRAAPSEKARVQQLAHVDARVSYGALAQRGLGVGPATHDETDAAPPCVCAADTHAGEPWTCPGIRARVRVLATVPDTWAHVGLLGIPGAPAEYPDTPGQSFETWADAAEVALAVQHGWSVQVRERLIFTKGAPLDGWAKRLERAWQGLAADKNTDVAPEVLAAVRWALRAVVLKTVGALAQTSYSSTRVYADARDVPDGTATFHQGPGGAIVTTERHELTRAGYPELTAQLWARGRVRLLDAPTADKGRRAGALHVPARAVVAVNTDALYLDGDPRWTDDGAWGRYRLKGLIGKPRAWPGSASRLWQLRDEAARELAGTVSRAEA